MGETMTHNADSGCLDRGEHEWKFNGGNVMCRRCGEYRDGYTQRVFSATQHEDGTFEVHTDDTER